MLRLADDMFLLQGLKYQQENILKKIWNEDNIYADNIYIPEHTQSQEESKEKFIRVNNNVDLRNVNNNTR